MVQGHNGHAGTQMTGNANTVCSDMYSMYRYFIISGEETGKLRSRDFDHVTSPGFSKGDLSRL